jgi:hypothetical protein
VSCAEFELLTSSCQCKSCLIVNCWHTWFTLT